MKTKDDGIRSRANDRIEHSVAGAVHEPPLLLIVMLILLLGGCGKSHVRIFDHMAPLIGDSSQVIIVDNNEAESSRAAASGFELTDGQWLRSFGSYDVSIGRKGFAAIGEKREGDGRTPSGIFALGTVFGYAASATTRMPYRQATTDDYWIDDERSEDYNRWVTGVPTAASYEKMRRDDNLYRYGIVIEYNSGPVRKGFGSAIFVHLREGEGKPTAGCVAMAEPDLLNILQWLDPARRPLIIMGTHEELLK